MQRRFWYTKKVVYNLTERVSYYRIVFIGEYMAVDIIKIGAYTVHGYGLMIGLGFLTCILYGMFRAKKSGLNDDLFFNMAVAVLVFGWLGGKILYCIVEIKEFIANPLALLGSEGFVVYGGILSGIFTIFIYSKIKKVDFLRYIDLFAESVPINQCFGRVGCFLAGCCYGRRTDAFYGVIFPEGCLAPAGVKLIPTQLISAFGDALIFIAIAIASNVISKNGTINNKMKGFSAALYLSLYGIGRFFVEFLRNDRRGNVWFLSTSQFISLFICAAGIVAICCISVNAKKFDNFN